MYELEELEEQVERVWEDTKLLYDEELEILLLQRELEQAERWLSSYENTLMAEEYGVGPQVTLRTKTVRLLTDETLRGDEPSCTTSLTPKH